VARFIAEAARLTAWINGRQEVLSEPRLWEVKALEWGLKFLGSSGAATWSRMSNYYLPRA
jgi:hypothetical protein